MASKDINNAKRAEMRQLATELVASAAWDRKELAAEMHVSVGTVGQWCRGKSMGTNDQRSYLATLLGEANRLENNR